MKRFLSYLLIAALILTAFPLTATTASDPISALESGYQNVLFSNGYRGFCLDRDLHGATSGNAFSSTDTSGATSNYDSRLIAQDLKVLFTQNFETLFTADGNGSYALSSTNANTVQAVIWHMTDNQYIWGVQKTLYNSIQAYTGPDIPDNGYQLTLANGDTITFSFMVIQPNNSSVQDFFAYKISVSNEPPHEHTPAPGWKSDSTQHWQECECGTVINNTTAPHSSNEPGNQAACEKQAVCDECGESYGATPSHSYTKEEIKDSALKTPGDCDQEAVYIKSCEHCGEVDPDTTNTFLGEKDADNHANYGTYLDGASQSDHKTQTDGYTGDEKCNGCDEIITPGHSIPVDPHVPESGWSGNDTHHWKECTVPGCGSVIEGSSTLHTSTEPGNQAACEKQAVCDECGESYGVTPSHSYTKEEIKDSALKTPGDCDQEAVYIKSCEHCGEVDPDTINTFLGEKDADNHANYGTYLDGASQPDHKTQTEGYTGDEKCNGCDEIITPGHSIPVDPHVPESGWSGNDTHHWKECTVPGCGTVIEGSSTLHTSTEPGNQAACEKQAVCDECGESYGATPSHSYTKEEIKDSALKTPGDCDQEAVYIKSCEHCGEVDPDTTNTFLGEKDADNHANYGTYLYGPDEADHKNQDDGYTGDVKCNACHEVITPGQVIPVDPHVPESGWSGNDTHHWKECTVPGCGTVIEGSSTLHTSTEPGNQAACEKQAVCDECGESYGATPPHNYGNEIPEDPAEIGKDGLKAHYQCSACQKYFVDINESKQEVSYSELIIPALLPPPTEPTVAPTEPTVAPTEPTAAPTQPTVAPSEPSVTPTEPTAAPTEPSVAPTEPTVAPTEPTIAPTEPSVAPTEPTAAPTEPTVAPTEPTAAPTEPTAAPTEPTAAPTEPTVAPTESTIAPTEPSIAPTEPTAAPTEPTATPTEPSAAPTEPGIAPTEPTVAPTEPGIAPTEPTVAPTEPTVAPTEPTAAPTEPGVTPTEPSIAPTEPGVAPTEPTVEPTEPANPPDSSDTVPPLTGDALLFLALFGLLLGYVCIALFWLDNKKKT